MSNPIPFNPDLMTVKQLKECAYMLAQTFEALNRGIDHENIIFHLENGQKRMLKEWSKS